MSDAAATMETTDLWFIFPPCIVAVRPTATCEVSVHQRGVGKESEEVRSTNARASALPPALGDGLGHFPGHAPEPA
jgi:hypothetical protein